MEHQSIFQVYNASAGSGKTFTLVKEYLKVILRTNDIYTFQNVLAITFTNKAAGEMKERVLKNLQEFSEGKQNDLLHLIIAETKIDAQTIKERSQRILHAILQNYSAFSITTIDSFTHKIIKSFAYDLGLSLNFEVEMDAVSLLNEAVDVLISKIGTHKELTKLLIDFSLDKIDEDKSWDISRELNEFSKILLNEDDNERFKKLATKKITDFTKLKTEIKKLNTQIEKEFKSLAEEVFVFIENNGISSSDFSYGDYPNHFQKFKRLNALKIEDIKFNGRLNTNIENDKNLYAGKASASVKKTLDGLKEQFHAYYYQSKELYESKFKIYFFNKIALKSIIPLAVLNHVNLELSAIKEEGNVRLNAEFNQLISDNIKDQPAPFIYERIGQRFMYYFIDEMQDTSILQWQNLIPLISNALSQENSSLLLVGDGKQAIYRWRGGKAAQFINLSSGTKNPFHIKENAKTLHTNFRSYHEIIEFNNHFFQHVANFLHNESYKQLFISGNKQQTTNKKGGFVSLSFLEKEEEKEANDLKYPKKVFEKIKTLQADFSLNEICVLVRKKKDGVAISNYLSENGINIVSSESLLLQNSQKVQFIINILQVIQHPENKEVLLEILYFLHTHLELQVNKNEFISRLVHQPIEMVFEELQHHQISFELSAIYKLPFYEKIEEIIRGFKLINSSDAYIQFFLDVIIEQQRKGVGIQEFLDFWDNKKEVLSIVVPEAENAVQVMTIHKSKGLEFPVIIFPCDLDIYNEQNPKTWINNLPAHFNGFEELLVPFKKDLSYFGNQGLEIYEEQRKELELDNFNLLYVALTRAVEQLHIITEKRLDKKSSNENLNYYSGIFINYLKQINMWSNEQEYYSFGDDKRVSVKENEVSLAENQQQYISTSWQSHNIKMLASASKLWDTNQGKAIEFGNLIHEIMSKIVVTSDVDSIIQQYQQNGIINESESTSIKNKIINIVTHPLLQQYYTEENTIYNEREIVDIDNQILIPDRLVFDKNNNVTIIDYKTGKSSNTYHQQLLKYERVLKSMNLQVTKKLLIYINEEILVEEI